MNEPTAQGRAPSPAARRRGTRRALAASTGLVLAALAVSLVIAEAAVRLLAPQQLVMLRPDIWRPDSTLGHQHQENADTRVNIGAGSVRFVTDGNGYRIDPTTPAPGARRSVLMVGDSFIEALSVECAAAIPERTRRSMEHSLGVRVRVDNAAVGGWDPNQYLLAARRALARRSYDLGVVFLFIANDIVANRVDSYPARPYATRHRLRWPRSHRRGEIIDAFLYPVNDVLETRSHVYILFKESMRVGLAKLGLTARQRIPDLFVKSHASSPCWQVTADICKDIEQEFARHGTPVLFVLLPADYQVHERTFQEYVESFGTDPQSVDLTQPNVRLRQEFAARGLRLLDPLPDLRQQAERGGRIYPKFDMHFNENGHRVVSEFLAPYLVSALAP